MKERLIKRFEDEVNALERELHMELPKEIQRARELGDLRENAEYAAAKERQRFVEARVSMLRTRVSQIQLMNLEKIPKDKAGFGSKLTLRENGREFVYELVMPEDADPERGLVSVASNLLPEVLVKLVQLCLDGDFTGALAQQKQFYPLFRGLMSLDVNVSSKLF